MSHQSKAGCSPFRATLPQGGDDPERGAGPLGQLTGPPDGQAAGVRQVQPPRGGDREDHQPLARPVGPAGQDGKQLGGHARERPGGGEGNGD